MDSSPVKRSSPALSKYSSATGSPGTPAQAVKAPANEEQGSGNSPPSSMSLRDQARLVDEVNKENFDLKMNIFYLEDRMLRMSPAHLENLAKENIDLKVKATSLERDLKFYKTKSEESEKALEAQLKANRESSGASEKISQKARSQEEALSRAQKEVKVLDEELAEVKEMLRIRTEELAESKRQSEETVERFEQQFFEQTGKGRQQIDLIRDLESQISSLTGEAEREHDRLQQDLERVKVATSRERDIRVRRTEEELRQRDERIAELDEELSKRALLLTHRDAELRDAMERFKDTDEQNTELSAAACSLRDENSRLSAELERATADADALRGELAELEVTRTREISNLRRVADSSETRWCESERRWAEERRQLEETVLRAAQDKARLVTREFMAFEVQSARREEAENWNRLVENLREEISSLKASNPGLEEPDGDPSSARYSRCLPDAMTGKHQAEQRALQEELCSLRDKVTALGLQLRGKQEQLAATARELDQAAGEHSRTIKNMTNAWSRETARLREAMAELRAQNTRASEEADAAREETQRSKKELRVAEEKLRGIEQALQKKEMEACTHQCVVPELKIVELQVTDLRTRLKDAECELAESRSELAESRSALAELQSELAQSRSQLKESEIRLSELRLQLKEAESRAPEEFHQTIGLRAKCTECDQLVAPQNLDRTHERCQALAEDQQRLRDMVAERNALLLMASGYLDNIYGSSGIRLPPAAVKLAETPESKSLSGEKFEDFSESMISRLKGLSQLEASFVDRGLSLKNTCFEQLESMRRQLHVHLEQIEAFQPIMSKMKDLQAHLNDTESELAESMSQLNRKEILLSEARIQLQEAQIQLQETRIQLQEAESRAAEERSKAMIDSKAKLAECDQLAETSRREFDEARVTCQALAEEQLQLRDMVTERNAALLMVFQHLETFCVSSGIHIPSAAVEGAETAESMNFLSGERFEDFSDSLIRRIKGLFDLKKRFLDQGREFLNACFEQFESMHLAIESRTQQLQQMEMIASHASLTQINLQDELAKKQQEIDDLQKLHMEELERKGLEVEALIKEQDKLLHVIAEAHEAAAENICRNSELVHRWREKAMKLTKARGLSDRRAVNAEEQLRLERLGAKERVAELLSNVQSLERQVDAGNHKIKQLQELVDAGNHETKKLQDLLELTKKKVAEYESGSVCPPDNLSTSAQTLIQINDKLRDDLTDKKHKLSDSEKREHSLTKELDAARQETRMLRKTLKMREKTIYQAVSRLSVANRKGLAETSFLPMGALDPDRADFSGDPGRTGGGEVVDAGGAKGEAVTD